MNQDDKSYLLEAALLISRQSSHPTVKVGATLLPHNSRMFIAAANEVVNRNTSSNQGEPNSNRILCAEQTTIAVAAKKGVSTDKATVASTLHPCKDCAKMIIRSGISEVILPSHTDLSGLKDKTVNSIEIAKKLFQDAGTKITILPTPQRVRQDIFSEFAGPITHYHF